MSQTTVRLIAPNDERGWRDLWTTYNASYPRTEETMSALTTQNFNRFLDPDDSVNCVVAISRADEVIGFVTWYLHPSTSHIGGKICMHDLYVDSSIRNSGVGRKLIEFVFAEADRKRIEVVYWFTAAENEVAQGLYGKIAKRTNFVRYERIGGKS